jgi:hypothetical protein
MEPVTYRIAVMLERCERLSFDLERAKTHLHELDVELRKLAQDAELPPGETPARDRNGQPEAGTVSL